MSLSRRGGTIAWRLRALCAPASNSGLGSALESTTTTTTADAATKLATVSTLHNFSTSLWSSSSSSQGHYSSGGHSAYGYFPSRNFSIIPGSGNNSNSSDTTDTLSDGASAAAASTAAGASSLDTNSAESILAAYTPDSIVEVAAVAERAALDLAQEGCWAPTRGLQYVIEKVHETTGLPWWASIMLTTIGIRTATFPIMLMQIKNTYALSQAKPEVEALVAHLKEEQARGNANAVSEYQTRVAAVWSKYNANPLKSIATLLVQAPMFIGFFSALRGMAAAKVPSLMEGGALWFTDLTIPDSTYALPLLASATFLLTVEAGAADGMEGQGDAMKSKMKNIMRAVAVIVVPFSGSMPASVFMYWTASNFFSLAQTLILKIPGVKPFLGIPILKSSTPKAEPGKPLTTFTQKPKPEAAPVAAAPVEKVAPAPAAAAAVQAAPKPKTKKAASKKKKRS
jgi:YidC/Oxa1 family membrane protein insertase